MDAGTTRHDSGRQGLPLSARYDLLEELGRGGMGVVHRARERSSGREVAVKLIALTDIDREARKRFRREAELAATLRHPGILTIHDAGEEPGKAWIACELVPDARALDEAWADLRQAGRVGLVRDAARALGYAHARGVVHRDVKARNILVGSDRRLRVADFGLALLRGGTKITDTGTLLGTPRAMAPEQVRGERDRIGPWTDVWALGVLLYEALTGKRPFEGKSLVDTMRRIVEVDPPRPRSLASVSDALEAVCLRALAKEPDERWPDGEAMAAALDAAMRAPGGRPRATTFALLLLLAGVGAAAHQRERWMPIVRSRLGEVADGAAPASSGGALASTLAASARREADEAPAAIISATLHDELTAARELIARSDFSGACERLAKGSHSSALPVRCLIALLRSDRQVELRDHAVPGLLRAVDALETFAEPPLETSNDPSRIDEEARRITWDRIGDETDVRARFWVEARAGESDVAGPDEVTLGLWRTVARQWGSSNSAQKLADRLRLRRDPRARREALVWLVALGERGDTELDASALREATSTACDLDVPDRAWIIALARRALRLEPGARSHLALAQALRRGGAPSELEEARASLEEGLRKEPDHLPTRDTLAGMLERGEGGPVDAERARALRGSR